MAGEFVKVTEKKRVQINPVSTQLQEKVQNKALYAEIVPHLSANDVWKSVLYIRNDSGFATEFIVEFFAPNGDLVKASFLDSDNNEIYDNYYDRILDGWEIITLEFDYLEFGASFQAFVYADESVSYSVEALFNRYDTNFNKQASVGVKGSFPGYFKILNVEERTDLFSETFNFRAFALTNTTDNFCDCTVELYDDGLFGVNLDGPLAIDDQNVFMEPRGKSVWYISDLFDVSVLPKGFGYILIDCSQVVTAMGLTFDEGNPNLAGSVPIDTIEFVNKDGKRGTRPARETEKSDRTR